MKITVVNEKKLDKIDKCLIFLAGRGGEGEILSFQYVKIIDDYLFIGITPPNKEWYPMPNGPNNQEKALSGMYESVVILNETIRDIEETYHIPRKRIGLVGFSAGGVMSLQLAAYTSNPFGCIICHAGAVLDPDNFLPCKIETPILLTHAKNDGVFSWKERFLPMKDTLETKNYNFSMIEHSNGHSVYVSNDVLFFLAQNL